MSLKTPSSLNTTETKLDRKVKDRVGRELVNVHLTKSRGSLCCLSKLIRLLTNT